MHRIEVKIMDNQQCEQALSTKFQNSLPHFSPNTLCGYSNVDQCKVNNSSSIFKIENELFFNYNLRLIMVAL